MKLTVASLVTLGLVLGACGGGDGVAAPTTTSTTATERRGETSTTAAAPANLIEVRISGGKVEGGPHRRTVALGETVTLRVIADVADEVHVHTYDRTVDTVAGNTVELTFVADIPGRHEVELEGGHLLLLTLEVR